MVPIVIGIVVTIVVAVAIVVFTAYPARGRQVPRAPWLNDAVARAADRMPAEVAEEFVPREPVGTSSH